MVIPSFKKGFLIANKSLLLVLAIGFLGIGYNLAVSPITTPIQQAMAPYQGPNPKPMEWSVIQPLLPQIFLMVIIGFLMSTFFQAGLWGYVVQKIKIDRGAIPDFFKLGARFFVPMAFLILLGLGFGFFVVVASILPMALAGFLAALTKNISPIPQVIVIVGALGMAAVLTFAIYLSMLFFGMATPALVAGDKKVMDSLKESKRFIHAVRFWPFVGLSALYGVVALGVYVVSVIVTILSGAANTPAGTPIQPMQVVLGAVFGIVFLYFDVAVKAGFVNYYLSANNNTSVAN